MRPQWSEAAALLAAHHLTLAPAVPGRATRWSRPDMPDVRHALFRDLEPATKPLRFETLADMARHLERRRDGRQLDLEEVEDLEFRGSDDLHVGVRVWACDAGGDRDECLGVAWLDGRGRDSLTAALLSVRPRYDRRAA